MIYVGKSSIAFLLLIAAAVFAAEGPTTTQPTPKTSPEWQQLHASFKATSKKGDSDLVFLGDSITHRWPKDIWAKHYGTLKAANFGINADKVENVLWRVQNGEFEGISPKVVVLLIGINNTWGAKKPEREQRGNDIVEGTKAVIAAMQQKAPKVKVLLLAIFPMKDGTDLTVKTANGLLAKLDDGKTIRFLDIGAKLAGADGKVSEEVMPDGLHPGPKGYEIWAEAMNPLLIEMLEKQ